MKVKINTALHVEVSLHEHQLLAGVSSSFRFQGVEPKYWA